MNSSHLRLGVALPGDVYDAHGHLLLSKNQILDSQTQLDRLMERGLYVDVSVFEAHYSRQSAAPPPEELKRFDPFLVRGTMRAPLNRLLYAIVAGSASPAQTVAQVIDMADAVQNYVDTDAEAAIAACLLERQEEARAAAHSLNSAILVSLLGHRLDWPQARRRSACCAALTMNVGMLDLHKRLARQATALTSAQREQVEAHPEGSLASLAGIGVDDADWLAAVREHHEKPGGEGYPRKLATPAEPGQLLRLADVFFARASARADRRALAPAQVIRALFVEEGQGPCAPLVAALVKTLGFYPPGSFVKLASGETAVVFRSGAGPKTPIAASLTNAAGVPAMQPVRRDTDRPAYAIVGTMAPDAVSVGYDLGKLWLAKPA